jgi:hypothetical protein
METTNPLPPRPDCYEKQLTAEQLKALHGALLARKATLEALREQCVPWRAGRFAGQQPSIVTLMNIRDRLEMELEQAEDSKTVESLLDQLKADVPQVTDEQLDEYGNKTFTLLAIRKRDDEMFRKMRSARSKYELERAKLALRERELDRQDEALALEKTKWQWDAAKACLDMLPELRSIAADNATTQDAKIDLVRQRLFGALPTTSSSSSS